MLFDGFVPLITSQVLGCEVSQVLHSNIERNKWLSILVSQGSGDLKLWGPQVLKADCTLILCFRLSQMSCRVLPSTTRNVTLLTLPYRLY